MKIHALLHLHTQTTNWLTGQKKVNNLKLRAQFIGVA